METLRPSSGFTSDASLSSAARPHTPPYTPHRNSSKPNNGKRRLERSNSPASSIHPFETSSPARKAARRAVHDHVKVEELTESDIGDLEVVYPEELEEVRSDDGDDELSTTDDDEDGDGAYSDTGGLTRRLSRMRCGDENAEADFEKGRRLRRMSKRMGSRIFKRRHSQSVQGDRSEVTDADAMDDQDVSASQRRLRRRTVGPGNDEVVFDEIPRSSPEVGSVLRGIKPATPEPEHVRMDQADLSMTDAMEVDGGP